MLLNPPVMSTHPSPSANQPYTLNTEDWGRTRYAEAFERQLERVSMRVDRTIGDTLIFTEHEPVFTIGRHKNAEQHLKWTRELLAHNGVEVELTNRGGDITYHGPGQLVGYPVIDLNATKDLHRYLRDVEEGVIRALRPFGILAERRPGLTGIWIGKRKIAAIGIAVKQWITYHGFALNVDPDLAHFGGIVPCGITDGTVTSMREELGKAPLMDEVKYTLAVEFQRIFAMYGVHVDQQTELAESQVAHRGNL
ncbi:MAG: lipoyl(octanoyl) transferase LipB [Opitutales bacterium]|nr:lipoyl(octanoyl) transferase LipB [Opitutales bacterium]